MRKHAREPSRLSSANGELFASDEALVTGMLANDPAAWREFRQRHDRLIVRCITMVTRRFPSLASAEDVREIHATLCVSLLSNDMHKLRAFDPTRGHRLSSWIGMLAINAAYDHLRAARREPHKACMIEAIRVPCDQPSPFELTAEHERASLARATLAKLSDKDRAFVALYFGEGLAPQAIADRMNISIHTVYAKRHKIQSRLESALLPRGRDARRIAA